MKKLTYLFLALLIVACSNDDSNGDDTPSATYSISVTASSNNDYTLVGTDANGEVNGSDPSITIIVGETISFNVNAASHPFYIKTVQGGGTSNQVSGVSNNGAINGNVSWTPAAAGTYYYQCSDHNAMYGIITVQ
jgi:plastocyanin|tara:strand:+ start:752 stop:1156 length:405 start_codon:yes stop_codon:yes gene_type:complete